VKELPGLDTADVRDATNVRLQTVVLVPCTLRDPSLRFWMTGGAVVSASNRVDSLTN
jgi:hypothetical protein